MDDNRQFWATQLALVLGDLQRVKGAFAERAARAERLGRKDVFLPSLGPYTDDSPAANQAVLLLEGLVAGALLDVAATLPVLVRSMHEQLLSGRQGQRYRQLLSTVGHTSPDRVVYKLSCAGGCLTLQALHLGGNGPLMAVTAVDREALARVVAAAGMDAPPPGVAALARPSEPPLSSVRPRSFGSLPPSLLRSGSGAEAFEAARISDSGGAGAAARAARAPLLSPPTKVARTGPRVTPEALMRPPTSGSAELGELVDRPSALQRARREQFRAGGAVRHFCVHLTREDCAAATGGGACGRRHYRRIIHPWTDLSLGNCPFLDSCRKAVCKYVHYEIEEDEAGGEGASAEGGAMRRGGVPGQVPAYLKALPEPQWVRCDARTFDLRVLGKFTVIMADPPWHIHQDLPYGTMDDAEMLSLNVQCLQDEGLIFLWVTGRAMELGRECLTHWGYDRVDELIWVKTNQLQRLIRTGRTGYWLNHSKEHCLIGIKGAPAINRHVDCDVLVAEVRETSRKPDEMYPLLERLSPGTRKLELFARQHNVRPGWVSLGNQLDGTRILDPDILDRYHRRYGALGAHEVEAATGPPGGGGALPAGMGGSGAVDGGGGGGGAYSVMV